jgi:hypothetical protein
MLAKLLAAKVAAVALTAAVAAGGVAAAATVVQSHRDTDKAAADDVAKPEAAEHASDRDAKGPDASGPARKGLCRAWAAGKGAEHGRKQDATAFQALAKAAGGADNVAGFCADVAATGKGKAAAGGELADAATAGLCRAWAKGAASEHGGRETVAAFQLLAKAAGGADRIAGFCGDAAKAPSKAQSTARSTVPSTTLPTLPTPAGKGDHPAPPTSIVPHGAAPDDPGKPSA